KQIFLILACLLCFSCEKQQGVTDSSSENLDRQSVDSIYSLRLQAPNDSLGREKLFEVASEYENRGLYVESKQTSKEIFQRATKKKDTLPQVRVYCYMADVYDNQENLVSAFLYYIKIEILYNL